MNEEYETLLSAIENKKAVLGVVGLGYVGLPLAVEMVKQGFTVIGIDLIPTKSTAFTAANPTLRIFRPKSLRHAWRPGALSRQRITA